MEFPGGKIEADETVQGAPKEIREELDTAVSIREPFGTYCHAYTHSV